MYPHGRLFADAIELYESAMQGPLGGSDPTLLKGWAAPACCRGMAWRRKACS